MQTLQNLFKTYAQAQKFDRQPQDLYAPVDYLLGLGGKAMRPILVLMGCELFGGQASEALPAAFAVELFHNFSLMHDDIMDNSPLRRGQPTVHIKYNPNTAILSGDVMLVYAYQYLSQTHTSPEKLAQIWQIFNRTAIGVCEGQQLDMRFETLEAQAVAVADYIEMIRLKTAVLLEGSLQMGAVLAGANAAQIQQIGEFGLSMGIAFQLRDDYLDTFGQSAEVGKRIGGDILQNKKTFLALTALQTASESQKQALLQAFAQAPESAEAESQKIKDITLIFKQLGVDNACEKSVDFYTQKALNALANLGVSEEATQPLRDFIQILMHRSF
jgi:geranylgeranyl diphosphate synthase type II